MYYKTTLMNENGIFVIINNNNNKQYILWNLIYWTVT